MKRISVVVPTYNRAELLRECLKALTNQDYSGCEIIVVDDGSTDGTREMVAAEFPRVRYLWQANRGPAAARNTGIRAGTGEIVAFTDDDCVPPPDWLSQLAAGYARHPDVAGVGSYLDPPDEALAGNAIAQFEYYLSHVVYAAGDREYLGGFECPAGGTNSMSYQRSILEELGGFDESFPYAAGEDTELKWRVCQAGHRLLYVPSRVIHLRPYTWEAFRRQQITHGRGAVHFECKHGRMPSRGRLLLRAAKRGLRFGPDLVQIGPALAWVKLWGGWFECWGQWQEVHKLRAAS